MSIRPNSPLLRNLVAAAFAGLIASTAMAQGTQVPAPITRDQHSAAESRIKADYKAADDRCDSLKDNAKDVCEKEAEGKRDVALAELEHSYKPGPENARKLREAQAKAAYEVADEKCDDLSGDAKDNCERKAKADYEAAKAAR